MLKLLLSVMANSARCNKTLLSAALILMGLGLMILFFVTSGPVNYLEFLPSYLQTALHPYVLFFVAEISFTIGFGLLTIWFFKSGKFIDRK
jgi:hypothetical protein